MLRIAACNVLPLLFASALVACSNGSGTTPGGGPNGPDGASSSDDSSVSGRDDSGSTKGPGDAGKSPDGPVDGASPHGEGGSPRDGGSPDGGGGSIDGGSGSTEGGSVDGGDAGPRNTGSCCSASTLPGCDDPNVEICVCQTFSSTCCTDAWTTACATLVTQKYCQPDVQACVCGTDAGQWDQPQCCSSMWDSFCDSVGTSHCGEVTGCF
ncbi:MAG: hypothetical protein ACRENE_27385 [Polyangiaceae bacterium]